MFFFLFLISNYKGHNLDKNSIFLYVTELGYNTVKVNKDKKKIKNTETKL